MRTALVFALFIIALVCTSATAERPAPKAADQDTTATAQRQAQRDQLVYNVGRIDAEIERLQAARKQTLQSIQKLDQAPATPKPVAKVAKPAATPAPAKPTPKPVVTPARGK